MSLIDSVIKGYVEGEENIFWYCQKIIRTCFLLKHGCITADECTRILIALNAYFLPFPEREDLAFELEKRDIIEMKNLLKTEFGICNS